MRCSRVRTLLTEIDVPNPDGALTPRIYCLVDLRFAQDTVADREATAIIFNQDGLSVAVVETASRICATSQWCATSRNRRGERRRA
jgi:hypothetical protein